MQASNDSRFLQRILKGTRSLLALNETTRPWHIPLLASFCVGIPALVGTYSGHLDLGILGCVGALVILYMPRTSIAHRMMTLAVCSFGFSACFTLGIATSFNAYLSAGVLGSTAMLVTVICRFYALPPPGSFFFIMVASLASTLPFDLSLVPLRVGVVALGGMLSCLLAFFYSLYAVRRMPPAGKEPAVDRRIEAIVLEAAVIGAFVGGSYLVALLMGLNNPYWVPISCAAIMQGATFRLVWHRNIHRIVGTVIGMGLAWVIFALPLGAWQLCLVIILLNYIIEFLVVRNYGLAVIFITPLTVIFADATTLTLSPERLVLIRLFDIVLGSVIGFIGGWVLHHPRLFACAETRMRQRKHASRGE